MNEEMEELRNRKMLAIGDYIFKKYRFEIPHAVRMAVGYLTHMTDEWWNRHKDVGPEDLLKTGAEHLLSQL